MYQAPVVQTLDSAIQRLNNWGLEGVDLGTECTITSAILFCLLVVPRPLHHS